MHEGGAMQKGGSVQGYGGCAMHVRGVQCT